MTEYDKSRFEGNEYVVPRARYHACWRAATPVLVIIPLILSFVFFVINFKDQYVLPIPEKASLLDSAIDAGSSRNVDFLLHPEKHVSRKQDVLRFSWNISKATIAPDGVDKEVFLINNQFPGPTIEARSGDILEINVLNSAQEGLSLHWHGLHLKGANRMDGPVGITQCPIKPGTNFTYQIPIVNQSGTFWYHAHSEVQRGDGLYGGLIVHNPFNPEKNTYQYDKELLLLVGDWYHRPAAEVVAWFQDRTSTGSEPVSDSLLVNGRGHFDCSKVSHSAPVPCSWIEPPQFSLNNELRYRVRLVNVGSMTGISLTVPHAELEVFQVDGGLPVTSNIANSIGVLYPGERVDFTLSWADLAQGMESQITIELDRELFLLPNPALSRIQSFSITANSPGLQATTANGIELQRFNLREAKGHLLDSPLPDPQAFYMIYTNVQVINQLDDEARGLVNRTIWEPQSLPLISLHREQWNNHQLVPWTGSEPVWVEFTINNVDKNGHPFHLHGYDFYVVASFEGKNGYNAYNPFDSMPPRGGPFNLLNPIRKDTIYVPRSGYVVIRFLADNEGIWALHCHVLWHAASGMSMALQVLGDEKKGFSESTAGIDATGHCSI